MKGRPAILTDLDNTVYNWVDFYAPCFRAMVHTLSGKTRIAESEIVSQFRKVFSLFGSVEYPFSIQHLDLCQNLPKDKIRELVYLGQLAFGRTRRKRLQPYPGVRETLKWANNQKILVLGVTNAPLYLAWRRIERLGLSGFFAGIVAGEDFPLPEGDIFAAEYRSKSNAVQRKLRWSLRSIKKKPDPAMYQDVLTAFQLSPSETWVVGDSLAKDVAPALAIGAKGVWARYGNVWEAHNFQTLLSITHWSEAQIVNTYSHHEVVPTAVIDSFAQLQNVVQPEQLSLLSDIS
jgi:FMN phosphatase YigB (HAD superfamily)